MHQMRQMPKHNMMPYTDEPQMMNMEPAVRNGFSFFFCQQQHSRIKPSRVSE